MKKLFTFLALFLLFQNLGWAQIPAGYYDSATGLSGASLKTALFNITKNPTVTSYTGLWTSFQTTDKDVYFENDGTVLDIYSEKPVATDPYNFTFVSDQCGTYSVEGNCYNREHSFPKSWFNSASPMYSDLFHIYPTDGKVNGMRSNYPYGPNNGESYTSSNGSKLGVCTAPGYSGLVFEPIDEFKGDLARTYFHMATCYEDLIPGWTSDVLDGSSFPAYTSWFLDILLQWNDQDPVSQKEIDRNNAIYAIQGNRNPYIDHPEYVNAVWGSGSTTPTVPAIPSNFALSATSSQINLSWSDLSNEEGYSIYRSTDNITFSLLTTLAINTVNYSDASVVEGTIYYYYINAYNAQGTGLSSSVLNGQLLPTGGITASDLFFSEYVEGSSYNKALEISNFTGNSIDLSAYVIKKQTNGAGSWSAGLSLSGIIAQGQSFVVANSLASQTVLDKANISTSALEMAYNGNDPVSLWKNGVLIDAIGTYNSTAVFGQDVTLIRNSNISSPNISYTVSEWTTNSVDYFTDLGTHTFDGATQVDTQAPSAPTALSVSNITETSLDLSWAASTDNVGVTAYDVYKDGVLLASVSSLNYSVSGLTSNTLYSFYVKAKDAALNISAASATVNATTLSAPDTQAPSAPTALSVSNITETSLDLSWAASTDNVGVTAYDVYKDGVLLASVSTLNYSVSGLNSNTLYSFYVKAKDAALNISAASATVNATTLAQSVVYCASMGNSVTDEWIGNVQIASINNSSSNSNGGYSDFTSISTTLAKGTNYTINITPTWSGTIYSEGEAVWIDFNQDGDFADAGEQVASIATSKTSPVSASFMIPTTALNGATRMRVSLKYNGVPTACETFSYGEVEDYMVYIVDGIIDTEAPSAPSSLSASNITENSLDLTWAASTDNVGVTAYDIYKDGALLTSVTTLNYSVSGLNANTSYSFYVKAKDASNNVSIASSSISVTTLVPTISYCSANGTNTSYEYIDRVVFNTIDNSSGANGGYADFSSISTSVNAGTSYNISLYPGFASSSYNEGWAVWIDYNQNGDFSDAGELVYSHAATSVAVNASFTISTAALNGNARMRIKMEYNATPSTSCGSFTYGEVEDYTLNIISTKGISKNNNFVEKSSDLVAYSVYPNPATSILYIDKAEQTSVSVYSLDGKLMLKKDVFRKSLNISSLKKGVYILKINNGSKIYNYKFMKQ